MTRALVSSDPAGAGFTTWNGAWLPRPEGTETPGPVGGCATGSGSIGIEPSARPRSSANAASPAGGAGPGRVSRWNTSSASTQASQTPAGDATAW
jgi:hypothetical protein